MNYYLGIDVGTTSARAGIFDQRGNLAAAEMNVVARAIAVERCDLFAQSIEPWNTESSPSTASAAGATPPAAQALLTPRCLLAAWFSRRREGGWIAETAFRD